MAIPLTPPLFIPGTKIINPEAKKFFKDLYQGQILAKFIKYPIKPYPFPFLDPREEAEPEPEISIMGSLFADLITNAVIQSPINKNSYNLVDAIKRENIMVEALEELSIQLEMAQKDIQTTLKEFC